MNRIRRNFKIADKDTIISLYQGGMAVPEIALKYKRNPSSIYNIINGAVRAEEKLIAEETHRKNTEEFVGKIGLIIELLQKILSKIDDCTLIKSIDIGDESLYDRGSTQSFLN